MIDEKYIELINKDIDGLITEKEKTDLQHYMKENAEARKFYKDMVNTTHLVDSAGEAEPSPNLKKRIKNSINPNFYKVVKKKPVLKSMISHIFIQPKPKLAFAFVTGVLVGVLIYSLLFINIQQSENTNDLYGTIGIESDAQFEQVQIIPIEFAEIQGRINIERLKNIFSFDIDLNTSEDNNILFEFSLEEIKFNNFTPLDLNKYSIERDNDFVKTSCLGNNNFFILFNHLSDDQANINLKLFLSGQLFFGTQVTLTKNK